MLKPQKKHAPEGIFVTDEYIGTGHWAVRLSALVGMTTKARACFATQAAADAVYGTWGRGAPNVARIFDPVGYANTKYHRTPLVMAGGVDTVCFRSDDGAMLWIDRKYADLLELETVRTDGKEHSCCFNLDGDIVVMPMRADLPAWFNVILKQQVAA